MDRVRNAVGSAVDYVRYIIRGRELWRKTRDLFENPPSDLNEYAKLQQEIDALWNEVRNVRMQPEFDATKLKEVSEADLAIFMRRASSDLDAPQDRPAPPPLVETFPYMEERDIHPRNDINVKHLLRAGDVIWRRSDGSGSKYAVRSANDQQRHSPPNDFLGWREEQTIAF